MKLSPLLLCPAAFARSESTGDLISFMLRKFVVGRPHEVWLVSCVCLTSCALQTAFTFQHAPTGTFLRFDPEHCQRSDPLHDESCIFCGSERLEPVVICCCDSAAGATHLCCQFLVDGAGIRTDSPAAAKLLSAPVTIDNMVCFCCALDESI